MFYANHFYKNIILHIFFLFLLIFLILKMFNFSMDGEWVGGTLFSVDCYINVC